MAAYAYWLAQGSQKYRVDVHAWVFMTNHVHLLLTPSCDRGTSSLMQYLGRQYVQQFNYKYSRTGTLFEGRFKSSMVQSDRYLLNCIQYIELNPVRAGLTSDPGDYVWSSYRSHAFGHTASLWSPHAQYLKLAETTLERQKVYRNLMDEKLPLDVIHKIRHCLNTGLVLGSEKFRDQVDSLRS